MAVEGKEPTKDNPNDTYITPEIVVDAALNLLPGPFKPLTILDPGAGTGRWGQGCRRKWGISPCITGMEIDQTLRMPRGYTYWTHADFRDYDSGREGLYDLVVTNPPYGVTNGKRDSRLAEKFIRNSMAYLQEGGYCLALLKTVFLEGEGRFSELFRDFPIKYVYVSAKRIAWRPDVNGKNSNTVSYSVFIWQKGRTVGAPKLHWFNWKTGEVL